MRKNLLFIPCLLLSPVGCTSSNTTSTLHDDVAKRPAQGFDTLEHEYEALCREINQLELRIVPPKGTSKADVERVFGPPNRFSSGGCGPPYVAYSLGRSNVELQVLFEGALARKQKDFAASRSQGHLIWDEASYAQTDRVDHASVSDPHAVQNEVMVPIGILVSRSRIEAPQLRATLEEYADRLASAPWNQR